MCKDRSFGNISGWQLCGSMFHTKATQWKKNSRWWRQWQQLNQMPEEIYEIKPIQIYKTGRDTDLQRLRQKSGKFKGEYYFCHWNPNALNYYSETDVPFRKELWMYIDKISSRRSLWNYHNILKLVKESEGIYDHIPNMQVCQFKKNA